MKHFILVLQLITVLARMAASVVRMIDLIIRTGGL